jgi:hypothetical protein
MPRTRSRVTRLPGQHKDIYPSKLRGRTDRIGLPLGCSRGCTPMHLGKVRGSGVLGFWGSGVLGFWGSGVLGFWGFGVLGHWALGSGLWG